VARGRSSTLSASLPNESIRAMAPSADAPPRITHISWGTLEVDNGAQSFKDAKPYPAGARKWDWNETGTSHTPGIQFADVEELLDHGADIVVLSRGMNERLRVKPETLRRLDEEGIETHVLETKRAVERFNELREQDEAVGGLFHSTC